MRNVPPPPWLLEEPALLNLLHQFIDRLDQGPVDETSGRLSLRITKKTCPELFEIQGDSHFLWSLVRSLDKQYQVWSVHMQRGKGSEAPFENARLDFNIDAEPMVRQWLHRPLIDPYVLIWQDAVEKNSHVFGVGYRFMLHSPLRCEGRTADEVIQALLRLAQVDKPITLRELSAQCFWGDSKFLETRENWLQECFPQVSRLLVPRPILLNVVIPAEMKGVLWIENQDTFVRFAEHPPEAAQSLALIYCAGFRATSPRIRDTGHVLFCSVASGRNSHSTEGLKSFWQGELSLPCAFFGDLDFAGMAILAGLRMIFPSMEAWQPGYGLMADMLDAGLGHAPEAAGKDAQLDPNITGCNYADHVLLPLLRKTRRAIDQEAVFWDSKN